MAQLKTPPPKLSPNEQEAFMNKAREIKPRYPTLRKRRESRPRLGLQTRPLLESVGPRPRHGRYQAALRPDWLSFDSSLLRERATTAADFDCAAIAGWPRTPQALLAHGRFDTRGRIERGPTWNGYKIKIPSILWRALVRVRTQN